MNLSEKIAIVPGSFDPITIGHEDIIRRTKRIFNRVIVAVCNNSDKHYCFSLQERFEMCEKVFQNDSDIQVLSCEQLVVDLYNQQQITAIVKGIRNSLDYEYEADLARINRAMGKAETVFIPCKSEYEHISSKMVREFSLYGKDITGLVPDSIKTQIMNKIGTKE